MFRQIISVSSNLCLVILIASVTHLVVGARVPAAPPNSFEWHTQNYNSIHANKLVQSIAANNNDTITLAPFSCVRNKASCDDHQCCFGQIACCKPTGVCGCRNPSDSSHSCPFDIATTSISSSASSSERSVVTNACIQTISRNPKAAMGAYNGVGGNGRGAAARNIRDQGKRQPRNAVTQEPIIKYEVTPEGHLNGFVRTAATGNAYVLTTTTKADFGPVKKFMAQFRAEELMQYLDGAVIDTLLSIYGCSR